MNLYKNIQYTNFSSQQLAPKKLPGLITQLKDLEISAKHQKTSFIYLSGDHKNIALMK